MKKKLMIILALAMMISLIIPASVQGNSSILIYPWQIPPDGNGERIITVPPGQEIRLGARWGACTRGLAQGWAVTADVAYEIDGQPIFPLLDNSRQYWSLPPVPVPNVDDYPCMNNFDTVWYVYWEYPLGTLASGDHPSHFDYWNDHLHLDGGDYDGNGKPDMSWEGTHIDFIIRVQ